MKCSRCRHENRRSPGSVSNVAGVLPSPAVAAAPRSQGASSTVTNVANQSVGTGIAPESGLAPAGRPESPRRPQARSAAQLRG